KSGLSRLFELQPDPYDVTQRRYIRVCVFKDVKNAVELRDLLRSGQIDAAMIRAELILEPFVLLAAANRAVHQSAHNRMFTRSLSAELIYSLSPTRNISESLNTFGIGEDSTNLIVALFDDEKGSKMTKLAKKIKGTAVTLDNIVQLANIHKIKKIYKVSDPALAAESLSDLIITRIVTKDVA
ncbi:UNVERIFIED_CONTAM: EKC/KEOPS complex subunit TPRKB, partial [Eudyptes robustus]